MNDWIKRFIVGTAYTLLPYNTFCKAQYWYHCRRKLNTDQPVTYSDKLWALKKYNRENNADLIRMCYDKYRVRPYIESKIGSEYLTELYGVYDKADEIDFDELPDSFVLKVTQSCGYNIIVKNKAELDYAEARKRLNKWQRISNSWFTRQTPEGYTLDGKARIICEELLRDKNGQLPDDIKIHCFNGRPEFICYNIDSVDEYGNKKHAYYKNTYDTDWNLIPVDMEHPRNEKITVERPPELDKMLELSAKLSQDFKFVRVDLYNYDGKIFFGELTFIPFGGCALIEPESYEYEFGKMLEI